MQRFLNVFRMIKKYHCTPTKDMVETILEELLLNPHLLADYANKRKNGIVKFKLKFD